MAAQDREPTITGDDLTPEQRQVMGVLNREGCQNVSRMAKGFGRSRRVVIGDVRKLIEYGLVYFDQADGVVSLTEFGESFNYRDSANTRQDLAAVGAYAAGMQESQLEEAEERTRKRIARDIEKRRREVLSGGPDRGEAFETNPHIEQLPDDFVEQAVERAKIAIGNGNWDNLRCLADSLEQEWLAVQASRVSLARKPYGQRLATHLAECYGPDGRRVGVRIVNAVESVCAATLGSVNEHWPFALSDAPMMGIEGLRLIGQVLIGAGIITYEEFDERMDDLRRTTTNNGMKMRKRPLVD